MEIIANHKITKEHKVEINLEIPFQEIEKEYNSIVKNYAGSISLPGFRKGKVPASMVKYKFGEDIQAETLNKIIPKAIDSGIKKNELKTYGPPEIEPKEREKIKYEEGQSLKLKVSCNLPPECKLPNIKDIPITATKIKIVPADLENTIRDKMLKFAKSEEVLPTQNWKLKDLFNLDLTFLTADEKITALNLTGHSFSYRATEKSKKVELGVGANPPFLNYLYTEMKAMKSGEEKQLNIHFPKDFEHEQLNNQKLQLRVKINKITRMITPPITKDILKELGYSSEAEMNEKLQAQIEDYAKEREILIDQAAALDAIKPNVEFKIPDIAVEYYLYEQWQQMVKQMLGGQEITDDRFKYPPETWINENKAKAREDIEKQMIIDTIKKQENIDIGEEEMNKEIEKMAEKSGQNLKDYRRELIKSGQFSTLKSNLIVKKSFEWLMAKTKIKKTVEKTFEEIAKEQ